MERPRRGRAHRLPRAALGVAWRGARTILLSAALGFAAFVVGAVLTARLDPPGWAAAVYPVYVAAGTVAAAYAGLLTALRRETQAIVAGLAGRLGALTSRTLAGLALPSGGVDPATLRRVAEARVPVRSRGRLRRLVTDFAVARAVEAAGLSVLRERLLALADDAERRGSRVVARDAVDAVAREGVGVAVASRLTLAWTATRAAVLLVAAALLLSLPVAALLAG